MKSNRFVFCLALASAALVGTHAQVFVAIETSNNGGGGPFGLTPDTTYGWSFSVQNSSISVSDLGFYDHNSDGLLDTHTVGIWNSAGTLLAQATVSAGTSATLSDSYRFSSIAPVTLAANQTYYIGGWSLAASDPVLAFTSQTYAPHVDFEMARQAPGSGFVWPEGSMSFVNEGVFGPNFSYSVVPEPHEYALVVGVGLVGFAVLRRRMRTAS